MPGPFPGVDPYLEHPARWPSMHQRLITGISNAPNDLLPPPYVADIGERLYVLQPERRIYPDLVLDLQAVFDRCYDEGPYARRVDYRREPSVLLPRADAEWADQLLRERGLRV
jgi:uncharacterized protein DUF4058